MGIVFAILVSVKVLTKKPANLQINEKNNHNFKRPKGLKKYAEKDEIQVANKCSKCIQNQ